MWRSSTTGFDLCHERSSCMSVVLYPLNQSIGLRILDDLEGQSAYCAGAICVRDRSNLADVSLFPAAREHVCLLNTPYIEEPSSPLASNVLYATLRIHVSFPEASFVLCGYVSGYTSRASIVPSRYDPPASESESHTLMSQRLAWSSPVMNSSTT